MINIGKVSKFIDTNEQNWTLNQTWHTIVAPKLLHLVTLSSALSLLVELILQKKLSTFGFSVYQVIFFDVNCSNLTATSPAVLRVFVIMHSCGKVTITNTIWFGKWTLSTWDFGVTCGQFPQAMSQVQNTTEISPVVLRVFVSMHSCWKFTITNTIRFGISTLLTWDSSVASGQVKFKGLKLQRHSLQWYVFL